MLCAKLIGWNMFCYENNKTEETKKQREMNEELLDGGLFIVPFFRVIIVCSR